MPRRALGLPWPPPLSHPTHGRAGFRFRRGYRLAPRPGRGWRGFVTNSSRPPHRDAPGGEVLLGLPDRVLAEVEDRGGQDGAGAAVGDALVQVFEGADATAGDDGDGHGLAHRPEELAVVAG